MTELATLDPHGVLIEPATLKIQRLLPGPIKRVWSYLTDSELRGQWLATGVMQPRAGTPFEFTWHNDKLDPPSRRPDGFAESHSMKATVTEWNPPRRLAFTWGEGERGGVSIELEPKGKDVLLTLVHARLPDRNSLLNVSAGWHAHLDLLVARAGNKQGFPFWEAWRRLKTEYEQRLPG